MNRRQAKKAYKKIHGYNPPKTELRFYPKYYRKLYRSIIAITISMAYSMHDLIENMFDTLKDTFEHIRAMSDDEFDKVVTEYSSKLTPEDIKVLKMIRRDIHV